MPLPPYYLKVILTSRIACVVAEMMYSRGVLQVPFESFSKGPRGFPYVFIITGKVTTLEPMHVQAVGHVNSNTPYLTQPNLPTYLGQPKSPTKFSQVLSMFIEPLRTHKWCSFSVLPQT